MVIPITTPSVAPDEPRLRRSAPGTGRSRSGPTFGVTSRASHVLALGAFAATKQHAVRAFMSQIECLGAEPADGPVLSAADLRARRVSVRIDRCCVVSAQSEETAEETAGEAREETSADYFEHMWSLGDDPWEHATRFYEGRKYDLTVAALRRPRYTQAFEPGCGIGLLTERLAQRCDSVIASDRHPRAVHVAASARGASASRFASCSFRKRGRRRRSI